MDPSLLWIPYVVVWGLVALVYHDEGWSAAIVMGALWPILLPVAILYKVMR